MKNAKICIIEKVFKIYNFQTFLSIILLQNKIITYCSKLFSTLSNIYVVYNKIILVILIIYVYFIIYLIIFIKITVAFSLLFK